MEESQQFFVWDCSNLVKLVILSNLHAMGTS